MTPNTPATIPGVYPYEYRCYCHEYGFVVHDPSEETEAKQRMTAHRREHEKKERH